MVQKNWYQTQVTKSVDSAPKIAEVNTPSIAASMTTSAPSAVKANSNSLGKIAEKALGSLATAAAAALSKKSTQDALKNLTQKGLTSVLDGMTKEKSKLIVTKMYWMDEKEIQLLSHVAIGQTATFIAETKDYLKGENIEFPFKNQHTGKTTTLKGKVGEDGIVKIKWTYKS